MTIFFASANKNKISEIAAMLPEHIQLKGLEDAGVTEEIPETGETIRENSLLKAQYLYDVLLKKGISAAVFADDSGLEVEALQGAPGVYSARYAGVPKSDEKNNIKLLAELKNKPHRRARFVTVITFIDAGQVKYFEGEVQGTIAFEPRGNNGFGYDPLFIPQGYRSTFGQLEPSVKKAISHRAEAVKKLLNYIAGQY